jgi:plastocyanin
MSRRLFVILALAGLGLAACSSNKSATPPATSSSTPAAARNTVQATSSLMFTPVSLSITKGSTVTWNNSSGVAHNVTFENGAAFNQALNDGTQIRRTFTTEGTFNYFCSIHGKSMHGTIVVT